MMRSVSFVDRLELEFPGNHSSHSLCLGDVDGDSLNELVLGTLEGALVVFRGSSETKPWKKCSDLGMISSVAVGDIMNTGKNQVMCCTVEGVCHIFDFNQAQPNATKASTEDSSKSVSTGIRPLHSQYLSLNVKTLLIASIDTSGCCDVFVGYTDRAVGAYRWNSTAKSLIALTERLPLNAQVGSLSVGLPPGSSSSGCGLLLVSQAGGTCVPLVYTTRNHTHQTHSNESERERGSETRVESGDVLVSDSWSVKLTYAKGGSDEAIGVVQRRNPIVGTEVVGNITPAPQSIQQSLLSREIREKGKKEGEGVERHVTVDSKPTEIRESSPTLDSVTQQVTQNLRGSGQAEEEPSGTLTGLCTLDGSIKLLKGESKQWELQVDHSIFSLHTLDITGSGGDEIVGCAWDGMTYIVDQKRNVVKFNFGENVCAFCAGHYGCDGGNIPCLVYTTFYGQIFVYNNVRLPSIPSSSLLQTLDSSDLPVELREDWTTLNDFQKRTCIRDCLYTH